MSSPGDITEKRKAEHLRLSIEENVASEKSAGWEKIEIPHRALPEIDFAQVQLNTKFLGLETSTPFLISSMTGGTPQGEEVNNVLCEFAQSENLLMGVGSQRVALEDRQKKNFDLRQRYPRAKLLANIGIVQLNYGVTADDLRWLVDQLQAQALILHANVLQEAIQFEGDRNFSNLLCHIAVIKRAVKVPLILKETGCGLDVKTCLAARDEGVDALDIAGLGGTHWGFLEGLRHPERAELGRIFRNWGIPTSDALSAVRQALGPEFPIIASGGIRNGLEAAKALYLGANLVGMAQPFLAAAQGGLQKLKTFLDLQKEALRIALFCSGCENVEAIRKL